MASKKERLVMNNVLRKKFVVAAILMIVVGVLTFGGVSLAGSSTARGAGDKDRGAIGLDSDCPSVTCPDFGIDQQLHKPAKTELDDAHVIVVASQCSADDTPTPGTCPSTESSDENTTLCPSTWGNGQLPNNPTATKGYVCVYVLGGTNLGTVIGTGAIHGSSIAPGTLATKLGFKVGWDPDNAGDTYVDAVWAYQS
jgi:hypothetical protein